MSKLCTKCGQVLEDNVLVCPYCGKEVENEEKQETNINDIIEIPVVNPTDSSTVEGTIPLVMSAPTLDDITPVSVQPQETIVVTETPSIVETPVSKPVVEITETPVFVEEKQTVEVVQVPEVALITEEVTEVVAPPVVEPAEVEQPLETAPVPEVAPTTEEVTEVVASPVVEPAEVEQPVETAPVPEVALITEEVTEVVAPPVVEPVEVEQPVELAPVPEVAPTTEEVTEVVASPVVEPAEVEQPVETAPVPEIAPTTEEVPKSNEGIPNESAISDNIKVTEAPTVVENTIEAATEPAPEVNITTAPVIVETAPDLGDVNNVLTTVETIVENNSLETISVDASENHLVEEEEVFEIPVMPEPSIVEINPEVLGNKYDTEEQINMEKLEAKKKLEEEERARRQQEELAKQQIPMERPDLLAGFGQPDPSEINIEEPKKKKSGGGKVALIIIILVAVLALVGGGAWFILSGGLDKLFNKEPETSYMDPVKTYYEGFNEGNFEKMTSAYVPCLAQSDSVVNTVTNAQNIKNQNANLKITFTESSVEVVNADDKKHLSKHLLDNCSTNVPTINDYKHVFIEQKTKLNTDSKEEVSNPEFWVAEIEEKWYIIFIQ